VLIGHFSLPSEHNQQNPPANRKQGLMPEEMSKTLLTNKKQGKMRLRDATNIF
jgi:hypothetical protein